MNGFTLLSVGPQPTSRFVEDAREVELEQDRAAKLETLVAFVFSARPCAADHPRQLPPLHSLPFVQRA